MLGHLPPETQQPRGPVNQSILACDAAFLLAQFRFRNHHLNCCLGDTLASLPLSHHGICPARVQPWMSPAPCLSVLALEELSVAGRNDTADLTLHPDFTTAVLILPPSLKKCLSEYVLLNFVRDFCKSVHNWDSPPVFFAWSCLALTSRFFRMDCRCFGSFLS